MAKTERAPSGNSRLDRAPVVLALFLAALLQPCVASAQSQPSVTLPPLDLGQTSFLDGEAGPGGLLEIIGNGTGAGYSTDRRGRSLDGRHRQWVSTVVVHPAYVSGVPLLGGHMGIEFLFPFSAVHLDVPGTPATTQGGVGDITISPFVQWSDGRLLGRALAVRLALQVVAPTGTYSPGRQVSAGQNAWQVSPYLAFTWRAADRWEVSGRAIYDWSGRNDRPAAMLAAASSQAADQFAMNLSASYAVSDNWRLGVAAYALQTLHDSRIDGRAIGGSGQRAFASGPGFRWSHGSTSVIGTAYREFATENRPEGFNAVLRLLQPF